MNLLIAVFFMSGIMDRSAVLYMIAGIFGPYIALVYELVITIARLHDMNWPAAIGFLFSYIKLQLTWSVFIGVHEPTLLLSVGFCLYLGVYVAFMVMLFIRKTYVEGILIDE